MWCYTYGGFQKSGYPQIIHVSRIFPNKNYPLLGTPMAMETPIYEQLHVSAEVFSVLIAAAFALMGLIPGDLWRSQMTHDEPANFWGVPSSFPLGIFSVFWPYVGWMGKFSGFPRSLTHAISGSVGYLSDVQAPGPQPISSWISRDIMDIIRWVNGCCFSVFWRRIYNKHVSWTTQYVAGSCIFFPVIPCHTSSGIYECTANRTSSFIWNYYECCCHCEWPLRSLSSFSKQHILFIQASNLKKHILDLPWDSRHFPWISTHHPFGGFLFRGVPLVIIHF